MLDNVENMIFNGINLANTFTNHENGTYFIVNSVSGRGIKAVENTLAHVAGMDGSYPSSSRLPSRQLTIDITMKGTSFTDLRKRIERLNEILFTRNVDVPIVFSDEPDRVYYGRIDEVTDTIEASHIYQAQITILCSDPFKYGEERTFSFPSDFVQVNNEGTTEAAPIFEMEVLEPATFAMIQNGDDEYQMLGRPHDTDTEPLEAEELILHDNMSSLSVWTDGTQVDDGAVAGRFATDGNEFRAADYGTGGAKWYGPALKRSLPESLQDFKAEMLIKNLNTGSSDLVGRVEMYLLDVNGAIIGRISLRDAWENLKRNRAEAYMRNPITGDKHYTITVREVPSGATGDPWFDFDGMLRLQRVGNRWSSYVAKKGDDGIHYARETRYFTDAENRFMDRVAQIQIHIGKFGQHPTCYMRISDLKVWKINNPDDHQVPYIVQSGDTITFDHKNAELLINGEDRTDLKDFGGTFFKLDPGQNGLVVQPDNAFNTRVRYRERYR